MTKSGDIVVESFCLGDWQTNCYVVHTADGGNAGSRACWIVDAGYEPDALLNYVEAQQLVPEAVVLTHAHVDHIAGLWDVRKAWPDVPIWIHEDEAEFLGDTSLNLSIALADPVVGPEPDRLLKDGETLSIAGHDFAVIHTPGHSPGGITLYNASANLALVGDALFAGSVGRTDFPTSDGPTLMASIAEKLYTLPGDTRVLPGHMTETTIGHEKATNPFVRG